MKAICPFCKNEIEIKKNLYSSVLCQCEAVGEIVLEGDEYDIVNYFFIDDSEELKDINSYLELSEPEYIDTIGGEYGENKIYLIFARKKEGKNEKEKM